jgi:hypothetical protein
MGKKITLESLGLTEEGFIHLLENNRQRDIADILNISLDTIRSIKSDIGYVKNKRVFKEWEPTISKEEIEHFYNNIPVVKVKEALGITSHAFYKHLKHYGIEKKNHKVYPDGINPRKISNVDEFEEYWRMVRIITERNYKKFIDKIDSERKRGRKYHLDHKFSVAEGFNYGVDPHIIGSVHNLEIIPYKENCSKGEKCSVSLEDLLEKTKSVEKYEIKKSNRGKKITLESLGLSEEEFVEKYKNTQLKDFVKELGVSEEVIRKIAKELGIFRGKNKTLDTYGVTEEEFIKTYENNKISDIKKILGMSGDMINKFAKELGLYKLVRIQ